MSIYFSPYLAFIRGAVSEWPGVTEKLCFETPAFYVGGKLFARLKEDGETLAIHTLDREKWIDLDPEVFYVTDHYQNYNYMLIRLGAVSKQVLTELLLAAWGERATRKLVKEMERRDGYQS